MMEIVVAEIMQDKIAIDDTPKKPEIPQL
jgi:hypothetical protein